MTASGNEMRPTQGVATGVPARRLDDVSPWARGFAVLAAIMMVVIGVLHAIAGLAAIFENEFYVVGANYAFQLDVTAWGWVHLLLGVLVAAAGFSSRSTRTMATGAS
jgi:hypothetical protein